MSKNRTKISLSVDKELNDKLENGSYNKSKLINSLLDKWLGLSKKDVNNFKKKV